MPEPSIDYTCSKCGATHTYRIVPEDPVDPGASAPPREVPSIDITCQSCGAVDQYQVVPDSVREGS